MDKKLKIWELALLAALCVTLCAAAGAEKRAEAIDGALIRLHVLAVSDAAEEQALKLRVRDAVLEELEPLLAQARDKSEALSLLAEALPQLRQTAERAAEGRSVAVTLTRESYPTRVYENLRLPAGEYDSLRVILGEGAGRNWWCVVFPPLCMSAESSEQLEEALGSDTCQLLSPDGRTAFRFKLLELWNFLETGN